MSFQIFTKEATNGKSFNQSLPRSSMDNNLPNTFQREFSILLQPTTLFLIFSYTIASLAVLLNAIEIKLIAKKIRKATDFEIVLLNLAIADLVNSILFVVVTVIIQNCRKGKELQYDGALYLTIVILDFSLRASMSFVAVIGIERLFAIKLPLQHRLWHLKWQRLVKYLLLTWLLDILLTVSWTIAEFLEEHKIPDKITTVDSYFTAGVFSVGIVLILVVYTWVFYLMTVRSLKLFHLENTALPINKNRTKKAMKKEKSSIGTCILVIVSFLICNLPFAIGLFQMQITMTSYIFVSLSGVLNPLIYFFKGYLEKRYAKKRLLTLASSEG